MLFGRIFAAPKRYPLAVHASLLGSRRDQKCGRIQRTLAASHDGVNFRGGANEFVTPPVHASVCDAAV